MEHILSPDLSEFLLSFAGEHEAQLQRAAELAAETIERNGLVHLAAGDMNSCGIFEPFMKPGCLCRFSPVTDPSLTALHGAYRAFLLRNTDRIGSYLYQYYRNIKKGDTIIVAGLLDTPAACEMIRHAAADGVHTIWIAPAAKDARQADVVIDFSDSPASAVFYCSLLLPAIAYEINLRAMAILTDAGVSYDVWQPFEPSFEQENIRLCTKYRSLVKQL